MTLSPIPARIIQTSKHRELPLSARAAVANLKALNPRFEYLLFTDDDVTAFVQKEFPDLREVFETFPFRIQRYDFFRYLAVYRLGPLREQASARILCVREESGFISEALLVKARYPDH